MKADEVYAKLKKMIGLVSVGMKNTTSTQNPDGSVTITINFTSGSPLSFTMTPVKGDKGVGIKDAQIKEIQNGENTEYRLILIDDKDNNIDAGNIPIPSAGSNPDITNLATKSDLKTHTDNTNIHVTSAEKSKWNAKLDNTGLKDYAKKADVNSSLDTKVDKVDGKSLVDDTEIARLATINNYDDSTIKQSINAKASISDVNTHTSDTVKHITSAERTLWNTVSNKSDKSHTHTKSQITDMPTKLSQFSNDSGFITRADVDTSKNHIHNNKAVLDGITSDLITDWNNAYSHTHYDDIHITTTERNKWNNKAEISDIPNLTNYATKTYVTDEIAKAETGGTVDLSGYAKTADVNAALDTKVDKVDGKSLISNAEITRLAQVDNYDDTAIKQSINNKANATDLTTHTGDTDIHITSSERTKWNNKAEMSDIPSLTNYATKTYVTDEINKASLSGTVDLTGYAKTIEVDNKLASKADKTEIPDISNLATKNELSTHTDNSSIHITASEKTAWNNKLDASALGAYTTTDDLNSALALKANKDELFSGDYDDLTNKPVIPDTSNFATKDELSTHTSDADIHITNTERTLWNNKLDNTDLTNYATKTYVTDEIAKAATSGTVDLTGYAKTADVNSALDNKVDKVDGKSLVSDVEITRLSKISNYDDTDIKSSITNINSELAKKANKSDLFSKSYNDLTDKPTIPSLDGYATKTYVTDEINKASLSGTVGKQKTIVCVVDDDGTDRTSDDYTGMTTWLKDKGIPMNFAICHDTIGTSGKYTVTQLQDLQAKGNDILIHGNPKLTTLSNENEVVTEIESALQFHTSNGLKPTNIYVYPQGVNSDGTLTATQVKEIVGRYFDYGLNVNIASMSGEDTKGLWNKVPLVDKLNIARMEISSTKGFNANKSKIDACVENKGLLILFTHSFQSQFTSGGYDEFKKIINYLLTKDVEFLTVSKALDKIEKIGKNYDDTQVKADIADLQSNKVDKVDGKGLSTNDYTTEEKTKVSKIVTSGDGSKFLANDGTYKKVSSSASAVAERKFKPVFGFDTYWGEIRDTQGNKNQVDLATIKKQIDQCEEMHLDKIICTVHIAWDETTSSLVIAENTDSLLSAISYCADKNVTIDTVKVHMQLKGASTSENNYVNNVIGMSTFKTKYKSMLTTICNLFKNTTVTRITILNEMWYITNSSLGHSTFINECLNLVKNAGYSTGITMAGFTSNQKLADAVIQNIDTFYINVYPGISGSGKYITKQEAIEAFNQCDVDLWIAKLKKDYPNKKIIISEMGTNDYWECLAAPSSWQVTGASKTGGYAVDTYITAMMEFFIRNNVEIEELWWWYDLYYAPVKETLLNYLGGDR